MQRMRPSCSTVVYILCVCIYVVIGMLKVHVRAILDYSYVCILYMIKSMNHNSLSCEHRIGLDVWKNEITQCAVHVSVLNDTILA